MSSEGLSTKSTKKVANPGKQSFIQRLHRMQEIFAKRNPLAHPAVLFRKSFFDKIGHCYRPEYRKNQDTMLWYDGLMHGVNIANLPNVVLKFRMTEALFKSAGMDGFLQKQLADRLQINKTCTTAIPPTYSPMPCSVCSSPLLG